MVRRIRKRTFEIFERATDDDRASRVVDIFILSLITFNVLAVVFETVEGLAVSFERFFVVFEIVSVIIFTIEYVFRMWSCIENKKYESPISGRIRFAFTPLAIIDLLAILPLYLPMIFPVDLRVLRALRLVRIFRMFKLGRYSESMRLLGRVVKNSREELCATLFVGGILLTVTASFMYFAEREAQPEVFSSIPAAMWWGIAILTTVGYGDVFPVTVMGKVLGAIMALLGIGMFAMPTGIISSEFVSEVGRRKKPPRTCPHCGKDIAG